MSISLLKTFLQQNICPEFIAVNMGEPVDVDFYIASSMLFFAFTYSLILLNIGYNQGYTESTVLVKDRGTQAAATSVMSDLTAIRVLEDLKNYMSSDDDLEDDDDEEEVVVNNTFDYINLQ